MKRLALLLLLVFAAPAAAELIRCRTADGTLVFTEDPTQVPADCQPVEAPAGGTTLNIVPSRDDLSTDSDLTDDRTPQADAAELAGWKTEAEGLVKRYADALKRRRRDSFMVDKQAAMREMAGLHGEKSALLDRLADSDLDRAEQRQIRAILEAIPEP